MALHSIFYNFLHDGRLPVLLAITLGPLPVWMLLMFPYQFFVDKPRPTRKVLLLGLALTLLPLPLTALSCQVIDLRCAGDIGKVADFISMTGTLCLSWAFCALLTNPLNRWFARRHARRLAKSP